MRSVPFPRALSSLSLHSSGKPHSSLPRDLVFNFTRLYVFPFVLEIFPCPARLTIRGEDMSPQSCRLFTLMDVGRAGLPISSSVSHRKVFAIPPPRNTEANESTPEPSLLHFSKVLFSRMFSFWAAPTAICPERLLFLSSSKAQVPRVLCSESH